MVLDSLDCNAYFGTGGIYIFWSGYMVLENNGHRFQIQGTIVYNTLLVAALELNNLLISVSSFHRISL